MYLEGFMMEKVIATLTTLQLEKSKTAGSKVSFICILLQEVSDRLRMGPKDQGPM